MIKYLSGLLAGVLLGAAVTAIVTVFWLRSQSSGNLGALLLVVFPVWSSFVSIPAYVISMLVRPSYATTPGQKRHPVSGALIAAFATLIASITVVALGWFQEAHRRVEGERRWAEVQDLQRRNPHALINDIALPDEEDSGYRVRFVDDKGVVRASNSLISVTPYVVLPPGRHRIVLHGDTPKAARLKLEWFLQGSVEVEAGHLYKLQVANGHIRLVEVSRFKEPNQVPEPISGSVTPHADARVAPLPAVAHR